MSGQIDIKLNEKHQVYSKERSDASTVNGAANTFVSSEGTLHGLNGSKQSSTSRSADNGVSPANISSGHDDADAKEEPIASAFLAEERKVSDPCLMQEDLQPYHAPTPDPDGRLKTAQLAGAQLLSNALVRSFLSSTFREKYPLESLTRIPQCVEQWCKKHQASFTNFSLAPKESLTLALEWAFDRSISRILFDHDYVRKLPLEPFDPNALQRYLQATMRNDKRNVAKLGDENLQHDDGHGDDGDWEPLIDRYATPPTQADRARLFQETLDDMCDVLTLDEQTAEILFQYYHCGVSRADIEATYGIAIESVRRRIKRAVEKSTEDGAMAEASLQQLITELHRSEDVVPIKRTRQEDTGAEDESVSLYTALEGWRWESIPSDDLI